MSTATFQAKDFTVTVELIDEQETVQNQLVIEAMFDKPVTATQEIKLQNSAVFSSPTEVSVEIGQIEPFVIVVEKPVTITVVEDNEIKFFVTEADLVNFPPVVITDSGTVEIASSLNASHFNRFLGICVADTLTGNNAPIKISGTITNSNWNWDVTKEIYLADGVLTQNPSGGELFSQQIANVLTPTTILITRNEPVLLG